MRYLSILTQKSLKKEPLKGYQKEESREDFYEDYIAYIQGLDQKDRKDKFDEFKEEDLYKKGLWKDRYRNLHQHVIKLRDRMGQFSSVIDADYWLFGLIHSVLFEGKPLRDGCEDDLKRKIQNKIFSAKDSREHKKDPNRLKFVRQRLNESIEIYREYVS